VREELRKRPVARRRSAQRRATQQRSGRPDLLRGEGHQTDEGEQQQQFLHADTLDAGCAPVGPQAGAPPAVQTASRSRAPVSLEGWRNLLIALASI
jgi:hypothetical protein